MDGTSNAVTAKGLTAGQAAPATTATTQVSGDFSIMDVVREEFQSGGTFMYPIAIMMILGSIVIVERLYTILFVYRASASGLMQKVQRLILDNNIEEAVKLCNRKKHAAIYQVFKAALVNADRPYDEIQDHVQVATMSVIPKLQQRVPYLFTIGNVATLMGLLGTVAGLVMTFKFVSVDVVEASDKRRLLTTGISTALNSTAFGLIVAIPCMLTYGYLYNRINGIIDEIDHYSGKLLLLLRTGSQYFDHFSSESGVTTQQTPKKARHVEQSTPLASASTMAPAASTNSQHHTASSGNRIDSFIPPRPAQPSDGDSHSGAHNADRTVFMEKDDSSDDESGGENAA